MISPLETLRVFKTLRVWHCSRKLLALVLEGGFARRLWSETPRDGGCEQVGIRHPHKHRKLLALVLEGGFARSLWPETPPRLGL